MTTSERIPCPFGLPNGVPHSDQSSFERLHSHAGSLAHAANQVDGIGGTQRLDTEGVADLLSSAQYVSGLAADALDLAVWAARDHGWSWQQIGDAFGISRQAAQQRFRGAK